MSNKSQTLYPLPNTPYPYFTLFTVSSTQITVLHHVTLYINHFPALLLLSFEHAEV